MPRNTALATAPNPSDWEPGPVAHKRYFTEHPHFGISANAPTGFHHMVSSELGATLVESGVLVKTVTGTWVAHRTHFPIVLTAVLMGMPVPGKARVLRATSPKR